jgi:hypothetical protein
VWLLNPLLRKKISHTTNNKAAHRMSQAPYNTAHFDITPDSKQSKDQTAPFYANPISFSWSM